jgi:hypothetical protein
MDHTTKESSTSFFDVRGFPKYARKKDDLNIVPYSAKILKDWGGHANIEFTEFSYSISYLFQNVYKGNKKVSAEFKEVKEN